jgi:sec-independent protein translocase protein TatC
MKNLGLLIKNKEKNQLTYNEHFQELRIRVILSLFVVLTCFLVLFSFSKPIIDFLTKPVYAFGIKLYYYKVSEAFISTLKSCFIASLILTSPLYVFILSGFIIPALSGKQKIMMFFIIFFIYVFFILGFYFSYIVLMPMSLNFFFSFAKDKFSSIISIEFYLDYFLSIFFCTGLGFQLPLVMLFLSRIGILNYKMLTKTRKHAIIIILIIGAILTPPDVVSQIILSVPLYLLYELGMMLILIFNKIKPKEE